MNRFLSAVALSTLAFSAFVWMLLFAALALPVMALGRLLRRFSRPLRRFSRPLPPQAGKPGEGNVYEGEFRVLK
jgi:hypothetical protein